MTLYFEEYYKLIIFFIISIALTFILVMLSYIVSPINSDNEKLSAYECGFDPFQDARMKFDIHFYLVGILFLIFDLEIALLFPWVTCLYAIGSTGFFSMIFFLIVLGLGFFYEWHKGAIDWA